MTYPSERWRSYVDTIALRQPAPTVAEIFAGMKILEERQNARDEAEHGEANYASKAAGGHRGAVGGVNQQRPRPKPKLLALVTTICYCCGRTGHYASKCSMRLTAFCSYCKVQGHLLSICKRSKDVAAAAGGAGGSGGGGEY